MLESLQIILQAWATERFSFHGQFWQVDNLAVVPKPVQQPHPTVHVAANSRDTFEMMGRMGYPICVASQVNPLPKIRDLIVLYRQAQTEAGQPSHGGDDVTLLMPAYVGANPALMRQELEPSIRHWLQTVASIYTAQNVAAREKRLEVVLDRVRRMTYEQVCESMAVFATPEGCTERLQQLAEAFGMGRIICWFNVGGLVPHEQVMHSMKLFAEKVMPYF